MTDIWARLRDRLASIDSSTSMVKVTSDYAAHFFDMYVKPHDGKHMKLQGMSVSLLELLKVNLPVKSGKRNTWKFEKAHSILHKVREPLLFGWSENVSTQGPEHCHIDFCKKVAACTNNKDVLLTIM